MKRGRRDRALVDDDGGWRFGGGKTEKGPIRAAPDGPGSKKGGGRPASRKEKKGNSASFSARVNASRKKKRRKTIRSS